PQSYALCPCPTLFRSGRIHVRTTEEVGLHVHLLDGKLARLNALPHPLMRRIEAARVAGHGDEAGLLRDAHDLLCILEAVGKRDLDRKSTRLNSSHVKI